MFATKDERLTVIEREPGIQISVGLPHDFRSVDLGPEEIALLAHALDKWIARFTSNA